MKQIGKITLNIRNFNLEVALHHMIMTLKLRSFKDRKQCYHLAYVKVVVSFCYELTISNLKQL